MQIILGIIITFFGASTSCHQINYSPMKPLLQVISTPSRPAKFMPSVRQKLKQAQQMLKASALNFRHLLRRRNPPQPLSLRNMESFQLNFHEMMRVFQKIDRDNDGRISKQELKNLLKALGIKKAEEEATYMFQAADANEDGFIDAQEYMSVLKGAVNMGEIESAFRIFDRNGDGKIDAEDVMVMLSNLGERHGIEDCRRMVRAVDRHGDGWLDRDDFIDMMTCTLRRVA